MTGAPADAPTSAVTSAPTDAPTNVLAGVVLAAGRGERLRPLTDLLPKALCPVGGTALVDLALDRLRPAVGDGPDHLAVNAHYRADDVVAHVGDRAHVSVERPVALGTAGALGRLREWLSGRDVLLTNADAYTPAGLSELLGGKGRTAGAWDGARCRLLVTPAPDGERGDFVLDERPVRYVGSCLLPWSVVRTLAAEPSGLYEVIWRDLGPAGLELVRAQDEVVDCGRPVDYLQANLHASGGRSVVGDGAQVLGTVERCVVWPDALVRPDERLVDAVRAGTPTEPLTVQVGRPASPSPA